MRYLVVLSILSFLSVASHASAATVQDNLSKYSNLRKRLKTEFMIVGEGQGKCLAAAEYRKDWMRWGDTTIDLGWYIGILATEYAMRSNPKTFVGADGGDPKSAQASANELYLALLALERLDKNAEAAFPSPCSQSKQLNGFFIRDDVPSSIHKQFPKANKASSDYSSALLTQKEMSQDQVYHLLVGLALVKRLVPKSVIVKGKELRGWAISQAELIVKHIVKNSWIVRNPACGNRQVARGPDARGFSGGTRLAIGFITDGAYQPAAFPGLGGAWGGLSNPSHFVYSDVDNLHMAMSIAAVGNGWGAATDDHLFTLAKKENWYLYPLLHRTLHGKKPGCKPCATVNQEARKQLDELPKGAEPASPQPKPPAVHGFTSTNRYIRGKDQAYVGASGSEGFRFNGLDYMLLHNLYALGAPELWGGASGAGGAGGQGGQVGVGGGSASGGAAGSTSSGGGNAGFGGVAGSGGQGGAATGGNGGKASGASESDSEGCSCRVKPARARGWIFVVGLLVVVQRLRRRERFS